MRPRFGRSPLVAAAGALFAALGACRPVGAQTASGATVTIRDVGPGRTGRLIRSALAAPHHLMVPDSATARLPRDSSYSTTVLVLGRDATVASSVQGDVIVVGGDLFLHPGAAIDGRAIAIGGGVYNSTLAVVRGGQFSYRDHTFDVVRTATGYELSYRLLDAPRPTGPYLPLVYGFRLPTYDRVNGLSLPWGPVFPFDTARYEVEPIVTYRSDLGAVDPALVATATWSRLTQATLRAERGTFTNDDWIRPDAANTIGTFFSGADTRNYYRADRVELRASRRREGVTSALEPFAGALTERAWSVGPTTVSESAPFSVLERRDRIEGMLRPNPQGARGRITSLVGGALGEWESQGVRTSAAAQIEVPVSAPSGNSFVQTTLDGDVQFPTFGTQSFSFATHVVLTRGDAPVQRFVYLGGSGTLPTLDLLSLGGDQLFYAESNYIVPLRRPELPFLGAPVVTLRHLIGSAGVDGLPALTQNVGVRVGLSFLRVDFVVDPETRDTQFSLGVALFRR